MHENRKVAAAAAAAVRCVNVVTPAQGGESAPQVCQQRCPTSWKQPVTQAQQVSVEQPCALSKCSDIRHAAAAVLQVAGSGPMARRQQSTSRQPSGEVGVCMVGQ